VKQKTKFGGALQPFTVKKILIIKTPGPLQPFTVEKSPKFPEFLGKLENILIINQNSPDIRQKSGFIPNFRKIPGRLQPFTVQKPIF
jgi:hypothetical protein